jgi:hypothetical protein
LLLRSKARSKVGKLRQKCLSLLVRRVMILLWSVTGGQHGEREGAVARRSLLRLPQAHLGLASSGPEVGNDMGITGIGFGLTAVGVARPVQGKTRDVEHSLIAFAQKSASKSAALPPG